MDLGLSDKVAFISGGSQGIGAAVAKLLSEEGARVAVAARSAVGLGELAKEIRERFGASILTLQADFSRPEDIESAIAKAAEHFGGLDILVNSAGSSMFGRFHQVPDETWLGDFNLKFFGTVRACRASLPHLRKRGVGRIINVAGNSGKQPYQWHLPGGAANAALVNFTHALAQELSADNILVTAVCPGPVETQRLRKQIKTMAEMWELPPEKAEKDFYAGLPFKRAATAEEVANLIVFLASDKASYISGTAITIDGCISKGI